ncbi:MAG: hypothetical protein WBF42_12605, partial [Terracidiphilus sp.]
LWPSLKPRLCAVVVMVMMMVVMVDGSGKCRTGKHNKKDCSPKLCHGENVARALRPAEPVQKMPHQDRKWAAQLGATRRGAQAGPGVNWNYDDRSRSFLCHQSQTLFL